MTQWGLDTIFNPAKRHMDEEKRRQQSTREEVGDNSGGKRINLESGKVRIEASADEDDDAGAPADSRESGAPTKSHAPAKGHGAKSATEPTAAQIRAAARRGRTLT